MKNWWLYVLKLEEGKFYVGITSKTPEERFKEHVQHRRAAYWTMQYRPIKIEFAQNLGVIPKEQAEEIENKKTREMIKEFGVNNVRGGDIRTTEKIIRRFGFYHKFDDWEAFTVMVLATLWGFFWMLLYFYK